MPNQTFSRYETVESNLRFIDTLTWMLVYRLGNMKTDDTEADISNTLQIISKLTREAQEALNEIIAHNRLVAQEQEVNNG